MNNRSEIISERFWSLTCVAEKILDDWDATTYCNILQEVIHRANKGRAWRFHIVTATAAQRAEAFLRTIGKWDDSK